MDSSITQKGLTKLPRPAHGNRLYFDPVANGLLVRVTAAGAISFVLNYRMVKRKRRYTIGRYPMLTLAEARAEAIHLQAGILKGIDPLDTRTSEREAPTMKDLADDYFEQHADKKKRATSLRNDHQMLDGVILPKLGRHTVASITRRDVESLHSSLRATPYQANRILALLSKMFSLAVQWHGSNPVWRADNPTIGIQRFQEHERERWLDEKELTSLTDALLKHPNQDAANAIQLLLLTGARKSEVLSATWSQFDLERKMWTKPSAHTKQNKTSHVPISELAWKLLTEMKSRAERRAGELLKETAKNGTRHIINDQSSTGDYLFPGKVDHLKDLKNDWRDLCRAAKFEQRVRVHDLRHTYASHLVSNGVPLAVVGKLLGHTQVATTKRYAHLADSPLREAANRFGDLISKGARP